MILDFHTHIGPFPGDKRAADLIAMLDAHRMDRAVTFPSRGLRGTPRVYAEANDYVADAAQRYPDRITGFLTVNPWHREEAYAEFERATRQLGLKGLKLHPPTQGFDIYNLDLVGPLMELARDAAIPVIIHGGLREHDNPLRFALLSQAFPAVRLVMLHSNFGGSDRVAIELAAKNAPNLYFETSATNEPRFVAQLAGWSGSHRIFFGSDWPWLPPRLELAMVEYSGLPADDIAAILGASAAVFLGLA
jgi:uncharacterized protein